jgi:transposase
MPCCSIGGHPAAEAINHELRLGESVRAVAARHGLSKSTIADHRSRCLGLGTKKAATASDAAPVDTGPDAATDTPTGPVQAAPRQPDTDTPVGQVIPLRKRIGRPSSLTPEMRESIARDIRAGCSFDDAAELNGIHPDTFYTWMGRGREGERPYCDFHEAVTRARADAKKEAIEAVRAGRMMNGDQDWKAKAWWLERMYPDEYGANTAVQVKVAKELTQVLDTLQKKLAPDVYNQVLGAIAGESSGGEAG